MYVRERDVGAGVEVERIDALWRSCSRRSIRGTSVRVSAIGCRTNGDDSGDGSYSKDAAGSIWRRSVAGEFGGEDECVAGVRNSITFPDKGEAQR